MSQLRNKAIQCDWCGKLTKGAGGEYRRKDGSYGRIVQPEWERFPGGDPTGPGIQTENDICEECASLRCYCCGQLVESSCRCEATNARPKESTNG